MLVVFLLTNCFLRCDDARWLSSDGKKLFTEDSPTRDWLGRFFWEFPLILSLIILLNDSHKIQKET